MHCLPAKYMFDGIRERTTATFANCFLMGTHRLRNKCEVDGVQRDPRTIWGENQARNLSLSGWALRLHMSL